MLARVVLRISPPASPWPVDIPSYSRFAMILALLPLGAAISGSGDQMLQPLAIGIIAAVTVQLPLVLFALPVVVGLTIRR